MPTEYTSVVYEGCTDLKTFATRCARGMGALVSMRDEPLDTPIPDKFEPNTQYYEEVLNKNETELSELLALDTFGKFIYQIKEIDSYNQYVRKYISDRKEIASRYLDMMEKVRSWDTKAEGLKEFMLKQLRDSLGFDCYGHTPEFKEITETWWDNKILKLNRNITYYKRKIYKEISRTEERNAWLTAFKESIND